MQPAPGVEQIAEEIRRRLARQESAAGLPVERAAADGKEHVYTVVDLLGYEGPALVNHVYRCLLKRDPLPEESKTVLAQLAADPEWKFELIRDLATSPEAVAAGVRLQTEPHTDTIGRLRLEVAALTRRQQESEAALRQELDAVRLIFTTLFDAKAGRQDIEEMLLEKVGRRDFDQLAEELRTQTRKEMAAFDARKADRTELADAVSVKPDLAHVLEIAAGKADTAAVRALQSTVHAQRARMLDIERRLALVLEESRKRVPNDAAIAAELQGMYDVMYLELENVFRGTRDEIRERQAVYVPYLAKAPLGEDRRAIDVGCGRGEFLEILTSQGFKARGVDVNRAMVELCSELGYDVEHSDGIAFLRSQPADSCAVISSFHVVEHLTMEQLFAFLAESLRVLRPGGILILETPNPENLMVSTRTFYTDPTHRHPLPSALLRFLVEAKGFVATDVEPLHPVPDFARPVVRESELLEELLFGPQDYGLIARKP